MVKISQKEAVYNAVVSVLSEAGIEVQEGTNVGTHMNKERRSQVNTILFDSFKNGTIELDRTFTDSELKAYVSGLQSNWLRKDKRLNGGTMYVAKNPGSRKGNGDASLKAMRSLLKTLSNEEDKAEVEAEIAARVAQIQAEKVKSVSIDASALPPALAAKYIK